MTHTYKVLNLFRTGETIYEIMRSVMPDEFRLQTLATGNRGEVLKQLEDAEFVIAVNMDAELIAAAPRLKLIQLSGVGFDGVDLEAARRAGIPVAQTVEGTILGVAEHTLLLILGLYKRLVLLDASMRRGEWLVWQHRHHSYTLAGKTVGIVGLGRIGREVAKRCRAFETQLLYHDPVRADRSIEESLNAQYRAVPRPPDSVGYCDTSSSSAPHDQAPFWRERIPTDEALIDLYQHSPRRPGS